VGGQLGPSWLVAFPVTLFVLPVVRRMTSALVESVDADPMKVDLE